MPPRCCWIMEDRRLQGSLGGSHASLATRGIFKNSAPKSFRQKASALTAMGDSRRGTPAQGRGGQENSWSRACAPPHRSS